MCGQFDCVTIVYNFSLPWFLVIVGETEGRPVVSLGGDNVDWTLSGSKTDGDEVTPVGWAMVTLCVVPVCSSQNRGGYIEYNKDCH